MKEKRKTRIKKVIGAIMIFALGAIATLSLSTAAADIPASQVTYTDNNQSTVNGALDDLFSKMNNPSGCTTPPFNIGDYISMTPTLGSYSISTALTGYTSNQTINPSELTLWRVIKKNPCNVEVVSEYTSSTAVYFRGTTGYANFVGALNEIARSYQNSKYTTGARMMGYNGQTEYITDTSSFDGSSTTAPSTTSTPTPTSGTGEEYSGGVLGDTLYLNDYTLVNNVYGNVIAYGVNATSTAQKYWLASRRFTYGSATYYDFHGRYVNTSGSINYSNLRTYNSGWSDASYDRRLRPILTLKSGLTIKSGSGTKTSPYNLN